MLIQTFNNTLLTSKVVSIKIGVKVIDCKTPVIAKFQTSMEVREENEENEQ